MELILEIRKLAVGGQTCFNAFLMNCGDVICSYYFNRYEQSNDSLRLYRGSLLVASFDVSLLTIKEV